MEPGAFRGALVHQVLPGSNGEAAELRPDLVLAEVDGVNVEHLSFYQAMNIVHSCQHDVSVDLAFVPMGPFDDLQNENGERLLCGERVSESELYQCVRHLWTGTTKQKYDTLECIERMSEDEECGFVLRAVKVIPALVFLVGNSSERSAVRNDAARALETLTTRMWDAEENCHLIRQCNLTSLHHALQQG